MNMGFLSMLSGAASSAGDGTAPTFGQTQMPAEVDLVLLLIASQDSQNEARFLPRTVIDVWGHEFKCTHVHLNDYYLSLISSY